MKYIMRNVDGVVAIHETDKLYRNGEMVAAIPESSKAMWKVVSPAISDWFLEKFWDLVNEEFFDFQTDNDIDDGDLDMMVDLRIHEAVDAMVDALAMGKAWQLANMEEK